MTKTPAGMPAGSLPPHDKTLRVRTAEDLIAVAAVVLGFWPEQSVVMITSDAERQFHARIDLPPPPRAPGWADEVADGLLVPARRNGVRSLAFLLYSDDDAAVRRAWSALRRRCQAFGIRVLEVLRVEAGRYYPQLAGPHLREVGAAYDVSSHPLVVRGVVEGRVVEPSRAALAATVGPEPASAAAVAAALATPGVVPAEGLPTTDAARRFWGDRVRALVIRHLADATRPSAREVAWTVWALQDTAVRDAAWTLMTVTGARGHADFWRDVLRRTPEQLVPAPACLFGWASWLAGNGALAWVGVERCQAVAPDDSMAALLGDFLAAAVPPEVGEPRAALLSRDAGRSA